MNVAYVRKMSRIPNLKQDDFKLVSYRKRSKNIHQNSQVNVITEIEIDKSVALRRIETAREEILGSDLLSSAFASLREGLSLLGNPAITEVVCLGLGHIGERVSARCQLAFLICIKNEYKVTVKVHDPIFSTVEKEILNELGFIVLEDNLEGKFQTKPESIVLYFLPHCPKQLTNNLLWSNWSLNLKNSIIIANSFTTIVENSTKRILNEQTPYLVKILPYTIELPIINTFKYFDVFNDTAIHIFPLNKLNLIPDDFWKYSPEPKYTTDQIEYITNEFVNIDL